MSSKDDDRENIDESVQETAEEPVRQTAVEHVEELDLFTSTTSGPVYSIPNVQTEKVSDASEMTQQQSAVKWSETPSGLSPSMMVSEPPPKVSSESHDESQDDTEEGKVSGHEDTLEPAQIPAELLSQPSEKKSRSVHVNMDALHDDAMKSKALLAGEKEQNSHHLRAMQICRESPFKTLRSTAFAPKELLMKQ